MDLPPGQNMLSLSGLSAYTADSAMLCFPLAPELGKKVLLWVPLYTEES